MRGHARSAAQRFSPIDRRRLKRAIPAAREARLYRRIEAVLLVAEGQPISEVARRVRATRLSVRSWVERYLATHDAATLADRPRRGRPHSAPRLTPRRLAAALTRDPRGCGYQATSWTVPLLRPISPATRGLGPQGYTGHSADHRCERQAGAVRCDQPADCAPGRAHPSACRRRRCSGILARNAAPLPHRRHDLAARRPGQRTYRRAH